MYDLEADITNKHVLIVEDIIDSGKYAFGSHEASCKTRRRRRQNLLPA